MDRFQVAVVGSGFAGTILARILHRLGIGVVLLERQEHPRFALGESSTPLAAISLERMARRYDLSDLGWLASYGRWMEQMPQVRRGLKRGFTFYGHRAGEIFEDSPDNERRLLVAASPDDAVADSHWLRADVDHHLVQRALAEGVDFRAGVEVQDLEGTDGQPWRLKGCRGDEPVELLAEFVIDGTGSASLLSNVLGIESDLDRIGLDTALVYGHFAGVEPFVELSPGPYPDERAAVHHLIEEGWVYVLPFDHDVVSAGIVLRRSVLERLTESGVEEPDAIWEAVLARYPSLWNQFSGARVVQSMGLIPRVQTRRAKAAGPGWALLPHGFAFLDPMYSTGIAWSLIAVERLVQILGDFYRDQGVLAASLTSGLERYDSLLQSEANQMARLLTAAHTAMADFDLFTSVSFLYFATVSFSEVDQRLRPDGRGGVAPAWQGFLGATDPSLEDLFSETLIRLENLERDDTGQASAGDRRSFRNWVVESIARRNVVGLGDPRRRNLYPVDLDLLIDRASLLEMTAEEMRHHLPLLRGVSSADRGQAGSIPLR